MTTIITTIGLDLVIPKQNSSGNKQRLGRIS